MATQKKTEMSQKIKQKAEDYWQGEQEMGKLYVQGKDEERGRREWRGSERKGKVGRTRGREPKLTVL
jgi:hypothetical protein